MTGVTQKIADVNSRQVGGDHYKTGGIELWDLFGPESIIFYATRYVQRWRKKDGVWDLEKALHCVQKLREIVKDSTWPTINGPLAVADDLFEAWLRNASMGPEEQTIVRRLINQWRDDVELEYVQDQIKYLIRKEKSCVSLLNEPVNKPDVSLQQVVKETQEHVRKQVEEQFARERRVPRMRFSDENPLIEAYGSEPWPKEDKPASYPWIVPFGEESRELVEGGEDLFKLFYTRRGPNWVLDPYVNSNAIPRPLRHCYVPRGDGHWTLDIRKCPPGERSRFPDLTSSKNMKEWEELPEWQRVLYTWDEMDTKYKLTDMTSAWHVEEVV